MIDWQGIATAPKDETLVLLYFPLGEYDEWQYDVGFWSPDGGWYRFEFSNEPFQHEPSHWAALNPPAADEQSVK